LPERELHAIPGAVHDAEPDVRFSDSLRRDGATGLPDDDENHDLAP